jgi:hypothetical protein
LIVDAMTTTTRGKKIKKLKRKKKKREYILELGVQNIQIE